VNVMLRFHVVRSFDSARVAAQWVPSGRRVVERIESLIEREWERALARPGVKLFDGPMCRLESWETREDRLHLKLSPTSYRLFVGTNLTHPELADTYGTDVLANPVGVSPALVTTDGFLMLGRRNDSVAYHPSRIHPFAGALEPRDALDIFAGVLRELAEELSLAGPEIADMCCTGIAEDVAMRQPELMFSVASTLTRAQIEAKVASEEHDASWSVRATPEAIQRAIADPLLTPVAVASLLLWGRGTFGDHWFNQASRRFVR